MDNFWNLISSEVKNQDYRGSWSRLQNEASFRPTLYIGVGGFGCNVIRKLKQEVNNLIPETQIAEGFTFLGLDTYPRDNNDILMGNEYVEMVGIHPANAAKDPDYRKFLDWFTKLSGKWSTSKSIGSGAGKVKSVGRIAFLYPPTLTKFHNNLNSAYSRMIQFRDNFNVSANPKVYIISTLAGGTGAGILLDTFIIVRQFFFDKVGINFDFQAILATPEALEGEARAGDFKEFYANTYATLKEIFHFVRGGTENVVYNLSGATSIKAGSDSIPNPLFIVTDRNKRIITKTLDPELSSLVVSYLLFEIQTPIEHEGGQPKPQDKENPDYDTLGHRGMPKAFSSIGSVRFGFPYEEIEKLFTLKIIGKTIEDELIGENCIGIIESWLQSNYLAEDKSDQLQDVIKTDKQNKPIRISVDTQGELGEKKRTEIGKACLDLIKTKQRSIEEQYKTVLEGKSIYILENAKKQLDAKFQELKNNKTIGTATAFLQELLQAIDIHRNSLSKELERNRQKLNDIHKKVENSANNVSMACKSSILGRKSRIESAISAFDAELEAYLNEQFTVWSQEFGIKVYDNLYLFCRDLNERWAKVVKILGDRIKFIHTEAFTQQIKINKMADINNRGDGNRFSIVDVQKASVIFDKYIGVEGEKAIVERLLQKMKNNELLYNSVDSNNTWLSKIEKDVREEVRLRISNLHLLEVINLFYSNKEDKDNLLDCIVALGSPLFPLDTQKAETEYDTSWVVAVHPNLKDEFLKIFLQYRPSGEAMLHAYFDSPFEVIIYCISHGYTAHSLSTVSEYKSDYDNLQGKYRKCLIEGIAHRPIHCWPNAHEWEEVVPKPPTEEEANKLFIVGRAFNLLFPSAVTSEGKPDGKKNQSFIFERGNYYYLIVDEGHKPEKLGHGLLEAVENFEDHLEWQERVRELTENKVSEFGKSQIRSRLEKEYIPIIDEEIEISERSDEHERTELLRELRRVLGKYIEQDLMERKV